MDVNYSSYLQLDRLLGSQKPLSEPKVHDELLFIITHQSFELWFKIIIDEILAVNSLVREDRVARAIPHLKRITAVAELFPMKLRILETMTPQSFLQFRDRLTPASGLQSLQFRRIEFLMNAADDIYFKMHDETAVEQLKKDSKNNVWTTFMSLLQDSYGMETAARDDQLKAVEYIYNNPKHLILKLFCEALIEIDEAFRKWRNAHALMAERMIGLKAGTGQKHTSALSSSESFKEGGVKYLQAIAGKKFFPILWEVRTTLTRGTD